MWWLDEMERQQNQAIGCLILIAALIGGVVTLGVQKACQYRVRVEKVK